MIKCYIITPIADKATLLKHPPKEGDIILCADGGYIRAMSLGLRPDGVIGDFDSMQSELDISCRVWRVPSHKDETDTFLCVQKGVEMGCKRFYVIGGIGGRLDHSYANLQLMAWGVENGVVISCHSRSDDAYMFSPGHYEISKRTNAYLSFFSYTDTVDGLTLEGVAYPIKDFTITNRFTLGVSNRFCEDMARISFLDGLLLMIISVESG